MLFIYLFFKFTAEGSFIRAKNNSSQNERGSGLGCLNLLYILHVIFPKALALWVFLNNNLDFNVKLVDFALFKGSLEYL